MILMSVAEASLARPPASLFCFFFDDPATPEIYTLSLHDALPIFCRREPRRTLPSRCRAWTTARRDRKSTRLNSSHLGISYAVFCLKKKTKKKEKTQTSNQQQHESREASHAQNPQAQHTNPTHKHE